MRKSRRRGFTLVEVFIALSAVLTIGSATWASVLFGRVGQGPLDACRLFVLPENPAVCQGYPPVAFGDIGAVRAWLQSRIWDPKSVTVDRRARSGSAKVPVTLAAIDSNEFVPLRKLSERGLVVARMIADPEGPEEYRYGFGGTSTAGKGFGNTFYLVLDRFKLNWFSFFWAWLNGSPSYRIATWTVYGQRTTGELVPLKSGRFTWCRHAHNETVRKDPAQFIGCDPAQEVMMLNARVVANPLLQQARFAGLRSDLAQRSLLDIAVQVTAADTTRAFRTSQIARTFDGLLTQPQMKFLVDLTYDIEVEPAWIICGVGCCSAEE